MKINFGVKATGTLLVGVDNPGIIQRQWNECVYRALEETVILWANSLVHKKFEPNARSEYPGLFFTRTRATQRIKWRRWGHSQPLVTGFLRMPPKDRWTIYGAVRRPPNIKVVKSRKRASASWPAPKVSQVYKEEVIAVNKKDVAAMSRIFRQSILVGVSGARWRQSAVRRGVPLRHRGPVRRRIIRTRLQARRLIRPGQMVTF